MSTKSFHISSTGEPAVCTAQVKCRLGGDSGKENHFDTADEARAAFEKQMSTESVATLSKNPELASATEDLYEIADELEKASLRVSKSNDESEGSEEGLANAADTIRHSLSGIDTTNRVKAINQLEGTVESLRKIAAESDEPEAVAYERAAEEVADALIKYQDGFDDSVKLTMSNGVMVRKGAVEAGNFIKSFSVPGTGNSYYDGSFEDLSKLVKENMHDFEPGIGSVNNDVILVNIPADKVKTTVTEITDSNRHLVVDEEHVRQAGEKPVVRKVIVGDPQPAKYAQVVMYRADVLEQDSGRSTDAEWEMVALLGKIDKVEPMHPTTMLRNSNHDEGGTYREYTDKEWADAHDYWSKHAYIVDKLN